MPKYLNHISSPQDIKNLSIKELQKLAREIREQIITVVSKTGGHLAPSLGTVELTLALHKVFNSPRDKIIWDVGHQCYAHKLITKRREDFHTLRQYGGIAGFPKRDESEYDAFGTGHSSTSISAGLGMSVAKEINKQDFKVICIIGDGSLTAGMAYESLNQAGFLHKDIIVILNDNKMSIAENVGGLAHYLNKLETTPIYTRLKTDIWDLLEKLPRGLTKKARDSARKLKEGLKNFIVPTVLFEELGLRYMGPIDGHNLDSLIENFNYVKEQNGPILIHVITEKGRGYKPAQTEPSKFHGIGAFNKDTGLVEKKGTLPSYSKIFGNTLIELANKDKRIVAITAAMPSGTGLDEFKDAFPDRFFDVGIAEQHAVTFAAGLALQGLRPVCAIYSTFLQRGFDQVIHDVCIQKIPVIFALDRAGIVGEDGPTHQGTFDLSYLRCIPNIIICSPRDENEFRSMLYTAINYTESPIAIRYPKSSVPDVGAGSTCDSRTPLRLKIGKAEVLKKGKKGLVAAIGSMVYPALEAVKDLDVGVINARFVKPIDSALFLQFKDTKIITVEENTITGGFGSAVLEFFNNKGISVNLLRIGLPDEFIEQGSRKLLLDKYALTPDKLKKKIEKFISNNV